MEDNKILEGIVKDIDGIKDFSLPTWESLPAIPLYMDQIIMYLESSLENLKVSDNKIITKSMINNYVKDGILRRPEKKKYEKDQLASLISISILKQVVTIPETKSLISAIDNPESMYEIFKTAHDNAITHVIELLKEACEAGESPTKTAIELAARASAEQWAAQKILDRLSNPEKTESK